MGDELQRQLERLRGALGRVEATLGRQGDGQGLVLARTIVGVADLASHLERVASDLEAGVSEQNATVYKRD